MATRKRNPVYAVANARFEHGYGHLTIHVYKALGDFGSHATLKIDCQAGGTAPGETYAWRYGIANDYDVLDVHALKKGYWLMRRMARILDKEYTERGSAKSYADFALRVLRAAGVRRVHLHQGVNSTFYGDVETLPCYDPVRNGDSLLNELHNLEQAIIARSC